ncbi:hypothetical protein RRF57_007481 [Xylaria bambusicola]|uniref:Uncharacterized protein n=1 Tax=Xylaria bambusicola TaxID=326684 RepID=A0AAN7UMU3_9PEZI
MSQSNGNTPDPTQGQNTTTQLKKFKNYCIELLKIIYRSLPQKEFEAIYMYLAGQGVVFSAPLTAIVNGEESQAQNDTPEPREEKVILPLSQKEFEALYMHLFQRGIVFWAPLSSIVEGKKPQAQIDIPRLQRETATLLLSREELEAIHLHLVRQGVIFSAPLNSIVEGEKPETRTDTPRPPGERDLPPLLQAHLNELARRQRMTIQANNN